MNRYQKPKVYKKKLRVSLYAKNLSLRSATDLLTDDLFAQYMTFIPFISKCGYSLS